jgi:O-antigen/teichoic acid export membrane protein
LPQEYSVFVEFYAFAGIINAVLTHGMETGFFRFMSNNGEKKSAVFSTAFLSILFFCLLFFVLGIIYKAELTKMVQSKNPYYETFIFWFLLTLSFDAISTIPFAKLRLEEKAQRFALIKIISPLVYFFFSLFFVFVIPYGIKQNWIFFDFISNYYNPNIGIGYVFLANLIASALSLVLLLPDIFTIKFDFSFSLWKKMFWYALPIMIAGIGAVINETMDKIFLRYLLPSNIAAHQVGIYGACYKVTTFMILFKQAYLLGIEPFFFSNAKNVNANETNAKLMYYFVVANCILLLGLITNIDIIKQIALGKQYWEGLDIVPLVLIATVFLGIYMNLSIWYKLNNKTYFGAIFTFIGVAITIFINFEFIPIYGYWASAWATFITYFVMMILSYFFGQKINPIPYPVKKILIHLALSISLGIASFYLFDQNPIIGNLILLMYLATVFFLDEKEINLLIKPKK